MLIPYILALLLSLGAAALASIFGWSFALLRLLLVAFALLCDLQLFSLMIGTVRDVWMAYDYAPVNGACQRRCRTGGARAIALRWLSR